MTTARCRPMLSSLQCSHFTLRTSFIRRAGNRTTAEMTPNQRARRPENAVMHLPQPSCVWSVILRWRVLGAAVCTLSAHGTYPISIAVNVRRRYSISDIVLRHVTPTTRRNSAARRNAYPSQRCCKFPNYLIFMRNYVKSY